MGIRISNSKANKFLRCRNMFKYRHIEKIEPKRKGLPLERGDWLHQLLEVHFSGKDWRLRHKKLTKRFDGLNWEDKEHLGDMPTDCERIMRSYVHHYRKEDADLNVLATELTLFVPLPHGHEFECKIDMVTEDEYGLWIWEHKSHDKLPGAEWRFLDSQTARYYYAVLRDGRFGSNLAGVVWDYLVTKPPTKPKLTKTGRLSKRKIVTDLHTYVESLKEYGLDIKDHRQVIKSLRKHNAFFQREVVPKDLAVVKQLMKEIVWTADEIERGVKPIRTIDKSCLWSCDYKGICAVELYGGDADYVRRAHYKPRERR